MEGSVHMSVFRSYPRLAKLIPLGLTHFEENGSEIGVLSERALAQHPNFRLSPAELRNSKPY
jgi:hypothetical protein